jgi:hypothetical protein
MVSIDHPSTTWWPGSIGIIIIINIIIIIIIIINYTQQ